MVPRSDTDNRRQAKRFRAQYLAKIVLDSEAMICCTVRDISTGGARIALDAQMPLPANFELFIASHDLRAHRARVCWREGNFAGVSFSPLAGQLEHRQLSAPSGMAYEAERLRVEVERDDLEPKQLTLRGIA